MKYVSLDPVTTPDVSDGLCLPYDVSLLRPIVDLGTFAVGPLFAKGVEAAFHRAESGESAPLFLQVHPSPRLREAIARRTGIAGYLARAVSDLAPELRTQRWNTLVEWVDHFDELPPQRRVHVAILLEAMCLHPVTIRTVPALPAEDFAGDPQRSALAMLRSIAEYKLDRAPATYARNLQLVSAVALDPRLPAGQRLSACLTLIVAHARMRARDEGMVAHWRTQAELHYRALGLDAPGTWLEHMRASTYWRAVSYLPYIRGDRARTVTELDRAESFARTALSVDDPWDRIVAEQNLHPLLETRVKEALWLDDLELASERARRLVEHDPHDAKVRLLEADLIWRRLGAEAALAAYRRAVEFGIPYAPLVFYRIGNCLQELGDHEGARDAYVSSLAEDPGAVSAVQRLLELPIGLDPAVGRWAQGLLSSAKRSLASASCSTEAR